MNEIATLSNQHESLLLELNRNPTMKNIEEMALLAEKIAALFFNIQKQTPQPYKIKIFGAVIPPFWAVSAATIAKEFIIGGLDSFLSESALKDCYTLLRSTNLSEEEQTEICYGAPSQKFALWLSGLSLGLAIWYINFRSSRSEKEVSKHLKQIDQLQAKIQDFPLWLDFFQKLKILKEKGSRASFNECIEGLINLHQKGNIQLKAITPEKAVSRLLSMLKIDLPELTALRNTVSDRTARRRKSTQGKEEIVKNVIEQQFPLIIF